MLAPSLPWFDLWKRAGGFGWGQLDRLATLHDPRQWRAWWLADLRQLTSDYLKSPGFLALMRFNLTLLTPQTMIKATPKSALPVR
jgi:hypothetical protein